jgi:hypothetical protein
MRTTSVRAAIDAAFAAHLHLATPRGARGFNPMHCNRKWAGAVMNGFNKSLAATFLSAAMLFTGAAQAMQIQQFDKMADQDQGEYVGLLVQGAEKVLIDEGRLDLQKQVHQLFSTTPPADKMGGFKFEAQRFCGSRIRS